MSAIRVPVRAAGGREGGASSGRRRLRVARTDALGAAVCLAVAVGEEAARRGRRRAPCLVPPPAAVFRDLAADPGLDDDERRGLAEREAGAARTPAAGRDGVAGEERVAAAAQRVRVLGAEVLELLRAGRE